MPLEASYVVAAVPTSEVKYRTNCAFGLYPSSGNSVGRFLLQIKVTKWQPCEICVRLSISRRCVLLGTRFWLWSRQLRICLSWGVLPVEKTGLCQAICTHVDFNFL